MDEENRRDENKNKRVANQAEDNDRIDDRIRRRDESKRDEQLTRREREERWPVG